jgi:hypothetical protein
MRFNETRFYPEDRGDMFTEILVTNYETTRYHNQGSTDQLVAQQFVCSFVTSEN